MLLQLFFCLFCEFGFSVKVCGTTLAQKVAYLIISVFPQVSALASSYFENFKLIIFFWSHAWPCSIATLSNMSWLRPSGCSREPIKCCQRGLWFLCSHLLVHSESRLEKSDFYHAFDCFVFCAKKSPLWTIPFYLFYSSPRRQTFIFSRHRFFWFFYKLLLVFYETHISSIKTYLRI